MLEVFRDFEIIGDQSKLTPFLAQLVKTLPHGWRRDMLREREIRHALRDPGQFAFRIDAADDRPEAHLFLVRSGSSIKVSNIVPSQFGRLSRAQYNSYIETLSQIALPIAMRLGLRAIVTSDRRDIRDLLTPDSFKALRTFSAAANKTSGSSHPLDRGRWMKFIVLEHAGGRRLDYDTLVRWLIEEEHWPETEAHDLGSEFEFARELLRTYDAERK